MATPRSCCWLRCVAATRRASAHCKARFSAPVYAGDTLQVLGWRDDSHAGAAGGSSRLLIEVRVTAGSAGGAAETRTVVNNAYFDYR